MTDSEPATNTTRERLPTGRRWLAQLVGIRGVVRHQTYDIDPQAVLGRAQDADVVIDDPGVSRAHALVWLDSGGSLFIEDRGSRNGVSVNGSKVKRRALARGDRVALGPGVEFECRLFAVLNEDLWSKHRDGLLGRVSAASAPDLGQTLAAVQTGLRTIRELRAQSTSAEVEAKETLDDVLRVVARARDLTDQVLALTAAERRSYEVLNLKQLVAQAHPIIDQMAGGRITVEREVDDEALVIANQSDLRVALFALCSNAIEAMPFGGILNVELSVTMLGDRPRAALSVRDTGPGMTESAVRAACEPFVTSKAKGVGDGLGLAAVTDIAHRHGGSLRIESRPNGGTRVTLMLPAEDPDELRLARTVETPAAPADKQGRRLLLVDDDEVVRRMTARLLRQSGYTVVEAGTGCEARTLYSTEQVELVLLDSKLPDMSGAEVYALLDDSHPAVRVVLLNADGTTRVEGLREQPNRLLVLPKPFSFTQLLDAIAVLLPRRTGLGDVAYRS